jgi:hypothetical protein
MPLETFDDALHSRIVQRCTQLESDAKERVELQNALETMFLMNLTLPNIETIKATISPIGRNKALGAMRIMAAANCTFSFPVDKNDPESRLKAENMELWLNRVWDVAGKIRQAYVKTEASYSGVLFGEIQASVISTAKILESARATKDPAAIKQAEFVANRVPYLYDVFDPRVGFPERNALGLTGHFKHVKKRTGEVIDMWGEELSGLSNSNRNVIVDYCEWWDYETHEVWLLGQNPIYQDQNLHPTIPIVAQIVDGSMLHSMDKAQIQPFLYAMEKSKLWERDSLVLTTTMNNTFSLGSNPTFGYEANQEGKKINVDWSVPGGVATWMVGENFSQIAKQVIDPALLQSKQMLNDLIEQSTMYAQSLGEPLKGNVAYSLNAMLEESGRLPLATIQENTAMALARLAEITMEMTKVGGTALKVQGGKDFVNLKPDDIPDNLVVGCTLDVTKSKNMRENAALFLQLTGGDRPAVTQEWGLEELLGVEQPRKMKEEVWEEKYSDMKAQTAFMVEQQTALEEAKLQIEQKRMEMQLEFEKKRAEVQGNMQAQQAQTTTPTEQPPTPGQVLPQVVSDGQMPQQAMPGQENMQMPDQQQSGVFGGKPVGALEAQTPEAMQNLPPEVLATLSGNAGAGMKDTRMSAPMQSQGTKGRKR